MAGLMFAPSVLFMALMMEIVLVSGSSLDQAPKHPARRSGSALLQTAKHHKAKLLSAEHEVTTQETAEVAHRAGHTVHSAPKEGLVEHTHSTHRAETCSDLVNHGTHFTVEIEVGTPGQKFDVVADTGSDAIIVPSCACVKAGYCNSKSRCFQGTNRSSTFAIADGPEGPPTIRMMFGSGPVQAVVASDTVRVGKLQTKMQDGILLMTDQLLNIKGQFEGILGLGLPSADAKKGLYRQSGGSEQASAGAVSASETHTLPGAKKENTGYVQHEAARGEGKDDLVAAYGANKGVNIFPFPANIEVEGAEAAEEEQVVTVEELESAGIPSMNLSPRSGSFLAIKPKPAAEHADVDQAASASKDEDGNSSIVVKGFMEEAGINRFSMCFNDGANGVLRLGTPKVENAHGSIGQVHWGLDFRGISVGDVAAPVQFCTPENMTKGQKTPCGAIPDSGTTAFMAPKEHLISLYDSLCDRWDRCKKNYTAMEDAAKGAREAAVKAYGVDPFNIQPASKAMIFQQLVLDCRRWLTKDKGLNELPPIHFHIGGSNGSTQTLNLYGWSYIIETQEKEFKYVYKNIPGLGKMPVGKNFTGHSNKVCSPAFSTMEYSTEQNGPVWILGTPIFYEYQVGYDMAAKPPSISFSNNTCGSCAGQKTSLMSQDVRTHKHGHARQPRQVNGPFRMPNMDFTQPL